MARISLDEVLAQSDLGGIDMVDPDSDIREAAEEVLDAVLQSFDATLLVLEEALREEAENDGLEVALHAELLSKAVFEVNLIGFDFEGDQ